MSDIIIVEPTANEKEILCSFLNGALERRMTREDWSWEYEGINKNKSAFVVIKSGDKYLGSQGFIPITRIINKATVITEKSENSFVDSSLRGQGMFEKLYSQGIALAHQRGAGT